MKRKRLLFITRHRLNENNGGANASKVFLKCFAKLFSDCSVILPAIDTPSPFVPPACHLYPYADHRSNISKGIDMYRGHICANELVVKSHLKEHHYDVAVVDHSFAGAGLCKVIKASGAQMVTIHHNVERDYLRDSAHEHSLLYRLPYLYFAKKAERDCLAYSDLNLTVTEQDAAEFRQWEGVRAESIHSWGIFEYEDMPAKTFSEVKDRHTFIITGSLCFEQSLRPILHFIDNYWPLVLGQCPEARLIVAGRNPAHQLVQACSRHSSINLVANPQDMAELVRQASFYLCPINAGSGRKLRVMDGLKQGLPVLCHDISAAGYESMAQANCLFAYHDEQSFQTALAHMLAATVNPDQVYSTFCNSYSVDTGTEQLRQLLNSHHII